MHIERLPLDLLILMVQRPGELISRTEIIARLWGPDVFIEVETAINTVVRKIRLALADSADAPVFVETIPARGYRFIAPVEVVGGAATAASAAQTTVTVAPVVTPVSPSAGGATRNRRVAASIAAALLLTVAVSVVVWWGARPAMTRTRIAVLPFEAISLDPARAYVAEALHDETIAALGQIDPDRIEVLSRRTMLQYGDRSTPITQIARDLDVDYLLESAIHTEGGHIRVTSRLIRAGDQSQIWTNTYDNEPASWLAFQRQLGATIAQQIRSTLSPGRLDALSRRHTRSPEAFQAYLEGLAAWNQLQPSTTRRALQLYARATELDPDYALPWAGIAIAYAAAPINADANPRQMDTLARRAAQRAMTANSRLAESLTAMGVVNFWFDWDWTNADTMFANAADADPTYALGWRMLGIVRSHQARHAEADEAMRRAVELEPDNEMNWSLRAQVALNGRQPTQATQWAQRAAGMLPGFWIADYHLAMAQEQLGDDAAALRTLDRRIASGADNSKLLALRGYILAKSGRSREARDQLDAIEAASKVDGRYVPPYARALVYAGLGDRSNALTWLERAFEARDVHLIALPTDPKWDPFQNDPRFRGLLARCGFAVTR